MSELLDRVRDRLAREGSSPSAAAVAAALRAEGGGLRGDTELLSVLRALQSEIGGAGVLDPLLADLEVTDVLVNAPDGFDASSKRSGRWPALAISVRRRCVVKLNIVCTSKHEPGFC